MASPYGVLGHVGLAKESVWGTAVSASDFFEILSESITTTKERFQTRNVTSNLYEADDEAGLERHAGDIVVAANPENVGHILNGVFGVNSVSVVLSGFLHTNEFTFATADTGSLSALPGYTLEVARGGVSTAFRYAGAQFTSVQLNVGANQDLRVTASVLAKARTFIQKSTASFPGSPLSPFVFSTCSLSIDGAAVNRFEAMTWTFDNQLEGVPVLNASDEIALTRRTGAQMVRLSGTVEFRDMTDFESFADQTEHRVTANFTLADSFNLLVDVPRAVFTEFPVQIPGAERITVDFSMMGRYHTGSGNAAKLTLTTVNSQF